MRVSDRGRPTSGCIRSFVVMRGVAEQFVRRQSSHFGWWWWLYFSARCDAIVVVIVIVIVIVKTSMHLTNHTIEVHIVVTTIISIHWPNMHVAVLIVIPLLFVVVNPRRLTSLMMVFNTSSSTLKLCLHGQSYRQEVSLRLSHPCPRFNLKMATIVRSLCCSYFFPLQRLWMS